MKLLHITSGKVAVWSHTDLPAYAIFPYYPSTPNYKTGDDQKPSKWATDSSSGRKIPISDEIAGACEKALSMGFDYLWVRSLCVDPTSMEEVEKAAETLFGRLRNSAVCIVFLDDLPVCTSPFDEEAWATCKYWARDSASQELVVAPRVEFYDQKWNHKCSKSSGEYLNIFSKVSRIPLDVLVNINKLWGTSNARSSSHMMDRPASLSQRHLPPSTQAQPLQHTFCPRLMHHPERDSARHSEQPIQACSQHHSGNAAPAGRPTGTKRDSSGHPVNTHFRGNSRIFSFNSDLDRYNGYDSSTCDESESDSDSSSSEIDSESEISSEDEDPQLDSTSYIESFLKAKEQFQAMRTELVDFAYEKTEEWMASANYVQPPDDRLPPRKRARTGDRQPQSTIYLKKIDKDDPNTVSVTRIDGYYHFACPYYVSNPAKHQKCLRKHDLQSVEDVVQHMGQHHREPPYCPRCCKAFNGAKERDTHFLSRVCETSSSRDVEGITERQKMKMEKRPNLYMGERKRWRRVWSITFPSVELEGSKTPYLEGLHEMRVGMARDYWARKSQDVIREFQSKNLQVHQDNVEGGVTLKIIEGLVLDDIIDRIMRSQETREGKE